MPTNMMQARRTYGEPISILANNDNLAFKSVGLDLGSLIADSDGKKYLPAGTFLQKPFSFTPTGASAPVQVSVVPFAKNLGVASNTINLGERGLAFLPGMVVTVAGAGYNNITLSGTVAAADTVTFTLATGITAVATAVTGETLTTMAVKLANAINANPAISRYLTAYSIGAIVHMVYHTEKVFSSSVARTGTISAPAILDANKLQDYAIGTVQSVSPTGLITLTSNSTQFLPVGFPVCRLFDPNTLMGVTVTEVVYEYSQSMGNPAIAEANDVAAYHSATLHRARLPFWSNYYATFLPEIKFFPN